MKPLKIAYLLILALLFFTPLSFGVQNPSGGNVTYIGNYTSSDDPGSEIISAGGYIHVMNINTTQQNPYWKGYVGNISGKLSLGDETNSLFDWAMDQTSGKLYASRNNTLNWNSIKCATPQEIESEDTDLGFQTTNSVSINKTFNNTLHDSFYAFFNEIEQNSCSSATLNVYENESAQTFQEIVLSDTNSNLIYSSILRSGEVGFNNQKYDFQMILPENQNVSKTEEYYFYIELV